VVIGPCAIPYKHLCFLFVPSQGVVTKKKTREGKGESGGMRKGGGRSRKT